MQVSLEMPDAWNSSSCWSSSPRWMKSDRDYLAPSLARFPPGVEAEGCGPRKSLGRPLQPVPVPAGRHRRPRASSPPMSHEPGSGEGQRGEPPHAKLPPSRRPDQQKRPGFPAPQKNGAGRRP